MNKNHRKSLGFFLLLFFCVLVRIFHGSRRTMCAFHFPPLFIWLVCIVSHLCSVCMCPLLFSGKRNPLSSHLSASAAARSSCSLLFSSCCNGGLPVVFVDRVLIGIPMNLFRNKWNLVYTNIITRYAKLLTRQKAATTKKNGTNKLSPASSTHQNRWRKMRAKLIQHSEWAQKNDAQCVETGDQRENTDKNWYSSNSSSSSSDSERARKKANTHIQQEPMKWTLMS